MHNQETLDAARNYYHLGFLDKFLENLSGPAMDNLVTVRAGGEMLSQKLEQVKESLGAPYQDKLKNIATAEAFFAKFYPQLKVNKLEEAQANDIAQLYSCYQALGGFGGPKNKYWARVSYNVGYFKDLKAVAKFVCEKIPQRLKLNTRAEYPARQQAYIETKAREYYAAQDYDNFAGMLFLLDGNYELRETRKLLTEAFHLVKDYLAERDVDHPLCALETVESFAANKGLFTNKLLGDAAWQALDKKPIGALIAAYRSGKKYAAREPATGKYCFFATRKDYAEHFAARVQAAPEKSPAGNER